MRANRNSRGKKAEKKRLSELKNSVSSDFQEVNTELKKAQNRLQVSQAEHERTNQQLERLSEHRVAYGQFIERFGNITPIGKEDELRTALGAVQAQLSKLEHQRESCQEGVSVLHRFHETISESMTPGQWLKSIEVRRAEIAVNISNLETQINDFRFQRETLDNERIAANASTRSAQDCLESKSIPYQPLHHVIDDLFLSDKRKREVLGVFSALLFAPVLSTETEAQQAAEALAEFGAQVPVFLRRSVVEYCKDAPIENIDNEMLLVGTTSGVITRSVSCLLDPQLVEREKESLDSKIEDMNIVIDSLNDELKFISDESESVIVARRAAKAVEENEVDKLETIQNELENCEGKIEGLIQQTGATIISIIRSAESYVRLGGKSKDDSIQARLEELSADIQTYNELIAEQQLKKSDLEDQQFTLNEKLELVLSNDQAVMLNRGSAGILEKYAKNTLNHCY